MYGRAVKDRVLGPEQPAVTEERGRPDAGDTAANAAACAAAVAIAVAGSVAAAAIGWDLVEQTRDRGVQADRPSAGHVHDDAVPPRNLSEFAPEPECQCHVARHLPARHIPCKTSVLARYQGNTSPITAVYLLWRHRTGPVAPNPPCGGAVFAL